MAAAPCDFAASLLDGAAPDQQRVVSGCSLLFGDTAYTGPLIDFVFRCPNFKSKETITIVHGTGLGTNLFGSFKPVEEPPIAETLVINCDNYFPWDIHGPNQSVTLDGVVDLPNDILAVVLHFGQNKPTP